MSDSDLNYHGQRFFEGLPSIESVQVPDRAAETLRTARDQISEERMNAIREGFRKAWKGGDQ